MSLEAEPVRYIGKETANIDYHDGQLRPAVGVHSYQVLRANRWNGHLADGFGWTYNHGPMLAYWHGAFYLQYVSSPVGESTHSAQTLLTRSADGITWERPAVVFPTWVLEEIPPGIARASEYPLLPGIHAHMGHRMGFYVAPNDRLLTVGFYGLIPHITASAFGKGGMGHVAREVRADGSFGPIYFVRYNPDSGWNARNSRYPFYTESDDAGLRAACEALLADKLITLQWWELDRGQDGFFSIEIPRDAAQIEGVRAPSHYHLPDGTVVVLGKRSKAAVSRDEGKSWSRIVDVPSIVMASSKVWGQRTSDGRYALVYNPSPDGEHRWPLAMVTSDDGVHFDTLLCVQGEVPPRRHHGRYKEYGPQYVRGIVEGNGTPPDGDLWLTYSMNKEDIWVSRVPVPVRHRVDGPVNDVFDGLPSGQELADWNTYSPLWAPVSVAEAPSTGGKSLWLEDRDPCDYAKAVRVFPESVQVGVRVRVLAMQTQAGQLYIETESPRGLPGTLVLFDADGLIKVRSGGGLTPALAYQPSRWYDVHVRADVTRHQYSVAIDGELVARRVRFVSSVSSLERLVLRTGPRRRHPTPDTVVFSLGDPWTTMPDLPGADEPVAPATFYIQRVTTEHGPHIAEQP